MTEPGYEERYRWAGPTLFGAVLAGLIVLFWWFLTG